MTERPEPVSDAECEAKGAEIISREAEREDELKSLQTGFLTGKITSEEYERRRKIVMQETAEENNEEPIKKADEDEGSDETQKTAPEKAARDAKAKNKQLNSNLWTILPVGLSLAVFGVSLAVNPNFVAKIIGFFLIFIGVAFDIFFTYMYIKDKREMLCPKCKEVYDYDEDIGYDLTDTVTKTYPYRENGATDHQKKTQLTYKFRIKCHCGKCGTSREYCKSVPGGTEYWDGAVEMHDPEETLEKYYRSGSMTKQMSKKGKLAARIVAAVLLAAAVLTLILGFTSCAADAPLEDPRDYYGTYYGMMDDTLMSITVGEDKRLVIAPYGDDSVKETYYYNYTHSTELKGKYEFDKKYNNKGALVIEIDRTHASIFWLIKTSGGYRLESNAGGYVYTKTDPTGGEETKPTDPTGGEDTKPTDESVTGFYKIYSVDGVIVPAADRNNATLRINGDNTYVLYMDGESMSGTWKYENGTYYLVDDGLNFTYNNNTISMGALVFKK